MGGSRYGIGYSISNEEDYALTKLGPALDQAAAYGVDYIELPLYAIDLVANGQVLPERLRRVKALTQGRPFGYTMHGPLGLNLMARSEELSIHKDVLKATLEVTAELGGVHYVAHGGNLPEGDDYDPEEHYARQRDSLAEIAGFAAEHGIIIVVENLFGGRAPLPSRLATEIAAIGHPSVRACLDFSHAYLLANARGIDFIAEAEALAPYAKHLHVHDSFGKLSNLRMNYRAERLAYGIGDLHLPAGRGSIPWDTLIKKCQFPEKPIFIHELAPAYWVSLPESLKAMREIAARGRIGAEQS